MGVQHVFLPSYFIFPKKQVTFLDKFIKLDIDMSVFKEKNIIRLSKVRPSRFGSVVAHPDLDGEVSGSSPGHTKNF